MLFSSANLLANERDRLLEAAFSPYRQAADSSLQRQNQAVLNYLWVDVYAAALYTEPGISPRQAVGNSHRQRLELYYFRAIDREDVIKAADEAGTSKLAIYGQEMDVATWALARACAHAVEPRPR